MLIYKINTKKNWKKKRKKKANLGWEKKSKLGKLILKNIEKKKENKKQIGLRKKNNFVFNYFDRTTKTT